MSRYNENTGKPCPSCIGMWIPFSWDRCLRCEAVRLKPIHETAIINLRSQLAKAISALEPTCREGRHSLISIYTEHGDDNHAVVRWCEQCGAVVIDEDMDGRISPGKVMSMQFPEFRRLASTTFTELKKI